MAKRGSWSNREGTQWSTRVLVVITCPRLEYTDRIGCYSGALVN